MDRFLLGHQMHEIISQDPGFRAGDGHNKKYPHGLKLQMADADDQPCQGNDAEIDQDISFKFSLVSDCCSINFKVDTGLKIKISKPNPQNANKDQPLPHD